MLATFILAASLSVAPVPDVPPAVGAPEPHLIHPAELQLRQEALEARQRPETLVGAGLGSLALGYGMSALSAWGAGVGNDLGCAIGNVVGDVAIGVAGGKSGAAVACPPPAERVLYIPVAGPLMYFARPHPFSSTGENVSIALDGIAQVGGVVAMAVGAVAWASQDDESKAPTHARLRLLPSAPGALAGASLQMRL